MIRMQESVPTSELSPVNLQIKAVYGECGIAQSAGWLGIFSTVWSRGCNRHLLGLQYMTTVIAVPRSYPHLMVIRAASNLGAHSIRTHLRRMAHLAC